jgi:hypothetical protein
MSPCLPVAFGRISSSSGGIDRTLCCSSCPVILSSFFHRGSCSWPRLRETTRYGESWFGNSIINIAQACIASLGTGTVVWR